jgi:hypothetical protein
MCMLLRRSRVPLDAKSLALGVFAFAVGYGRSCFAVGFAAAFSFALIPVLFSLGHGDFALDLPFTEIKASWDERMSFDLRLSR